nr:hypothetical protein [Sphingomonas oligoaromativorans]
MLFEFCHCPTVDGLIVGWQLHHGLLRDFGQGADKIELLAFEFLQTLDQCPWGILIFLEPACQAGNPTPDFVELGLQAGTFAARCNAIRVELLLKSRRKPLDDRWGQQTISNAREHAILEFGDADRGIGARLTHRSLAAPPSSGAYENSAAASACHEAGQEMRRPLRA